LWWIDGQHLIAFRHPGGASGGQLVGDVENLSELMRRIPWSDLTGYAVEPGEPGERHRKRFAKPTEATA
jgi:hypothetical protein